MDELKIILKPQLVSVVLRKFIKPQSQTVVLRIFMKLLKSVTDNGFTHLKKKFIDAYVDAKRLV